MYKIKSKTKEKRIDTFLHSVIKNLSRTRLKNLIKEGNLKINNKVVKEPSKQVNINDEIILQTPQPNKVKLLPYKTRLNIVYEDHDLIIINKSSGMVVHPGAGNFTKTLVNALLHHTRNNLSNIGGRLRPGIVHRIDKDTSGLIVIAKNDNSHLNLSKQFSDHTIKRKYEALIWGSLRPLNGRINEKISRSKKNRKLMEVSYSKGKTAITNYKTIEIYQNINIPKISLVEFELETGRTHQIRVHMLFKGNPILGDKSYGNKKKKFKNIDLFVEKKINSFNRQALHAKSLGFIHPTTEKLVTFNAPRPKDLEALLKSLKNHRN